MPQTNVLPDWRATYPNDAPVQKPPGVTVSTTATAPRVPNKFVYAAGTIQSYDPETGLMRQLIIDKIQDKIQEEAEKPKAKVEEPDEEEEDDDGSDRTPPQRGRRR
jgi:hypothetical protein